MGSATQDFACLAPALAASLALAQHHPPKPIVIKAEAASSVSATQRRDEAAGTCSFCPSSLAGARRSHGPALPLVTPARTAVPAPGASGGSSRRAPAWLSPLRSGDRPRGARAEASAGVRGTSRPRWPWRRAGCPPAAPAQPPMGDLSCLCTYHCLLTIEPSAQQQETPGRHRSRLITQL